MKKLILMVTFLSFGWIGFAQDFVDNALLFSRTRPGGSARIQAVGGAQTSLGGDFSSALSNPAGLGMYNRSEFTITPGLTFQNNSSDYLGTPGEAFKSVFNIPGLSFVYHNPSGKETGFLGGSFAVTMTRINDLNRNYRYKGTNDQHSMIDYFINDASGFNGHPAYEPSSMLWDNNGTGDNFYTLTGLAYNNYLIEDVPAGSATYNSVLSPLPAEPGLPGEPDLPAEVRTIDQEEVNEAKGGQSQWSFSYGANFGDKFFLGAGVGLASIRYKVKQIFRESNFRYSIDGEDSEYDPIDHFQTMETYDISGSGLNLTLGAIFRPVNFLQIGASLVTPTYYTITDNYTARVESQWNIYDEPGYPGQPDVYEEFDQPLISEYNLATPMRVNAGATFISKYGFVTADVEFVNYSKTRYNSGFPDDYDGENADIKAFYTNVVNYRGGAEFRYENYRIRAGYSYMSDPYRNANEVDRSIQSVTGGLGFRTKNFFMDLAAIFNKTEGRRSPYFVDGPDPIAFQKFRNTTYMLTFGFTF